MNYILPVVCRMSHVLYHFVYVCVSDVHHFVLSYVFTLWAPCCDVRYIIWCARYICSLLEDSCLIYVIFACLHIVVSNTLTIWAAWWVPYKMQERLSLHGSLLPPVLVRSVLLIILVLCVVLFALFVFVLCLMYPMLPVSQDCQFLVLLTIKFSLTFI